MRGTCPQPWNAGCAKGNPLSLLKRTECTRVGNHLAGRAVDGQPVDWHELASKTERSRLTHPIEMV